MDKKSDDFKSDVSGFSLLQRFSDTVRVAYEDTQTSQHLDTTWKISALFEIPTVGSDRPKWVKLSRNSKCVAV
eukprot:TRINITY_DN5740_c0_g1_i1.p2 TRINITY_DN5740_c0_g1~~TRINITY_DN5740_c0_g1_i1.p2  ORF type:complete len:73 (+),score=8.11 TRINITY_DN5740_c0_g1_i1:215-433(+)